MNAPMHSAIALDLGTTSIKAGLLGREGELRNIIALPAPKIAVNGGRYESDAISYAKTVEQVLNDSIDCASDCKTLGMCSQRSSFLLWEQTTGQPVTPLISWQDTRGAASFEALRGNEKNIRNLAGLPLTPYYFTPKLRVVLLDNPEWRIRLEQGELLVGTLDTFLIWRWTGGKKYVTDASMAARTLLMDISHLQWSPPLCDLFGIPLHILPEIKPSAGMNIKLDNGLVLQASVGDQSAALFASVSEGQPEALVNLGTGCFVVRYLPEGKTASNGYLQTLVYQDGARKVHFAIEGTLNSITAALAPYPVDECVVDDLGRDEVFCIAEPSGLGAPYFRGDIGIRFSKPVEHFSKTRIAALMLEAVIFRAARMLEEIHRVYAIDRVYLSGGLSELICLQNGIARCVPFDVYRLGQSESSLHGAALLAAGMECRRDGTKVRVTGDAMLLQEKFRRWKVWLDGLLA